MKTKLFAAALLVASSRLASAADAVSVYDPAPSAPIPTAAFSWSGGYIGANAGYGWGNGDAVDLGDDFFDEDFGQTHDVRTDGFIGGVQVGYNWQSSSFVYGIEANLGYLGLDGENRILVSPDNSGSAELGIYGDLTARFGFAVDRILLYAKGGVAATRYDLTYGDLVDDGGLDEDSSASRSGGNVGYTLGGGVEWAFNDRWSTKLEYQYFDFGTVTLTDIEGDQADVDLDAHTIKVGLSYRF